MVNSNQLRPGENRLPLSFAKKKAPSTGKCWSWTGYSPSNRGYPFLCRFADWSRSRLRCLQKRLVSLIMCASHKKALMTYPFWNQKGDFFQCILDWSSFPMAKNEKHPGLAHHQTMNLRASSQRRAVKCPCESLLLLLQLTHRDKIFKSAWCWMRNPILRLYWDNYLSGVLRTTCLRP